MAVSACTTPYQREDALGGYTDKRLPNGDYLIAVRVNGYTSRGAAFEYLHRRAGELCPAGYDVIDRTGGDNGADNGWETTHKPEEDAVVRCHAGGPTPVVAAGYWCASGGDGTCWPDNHACVSAGGGCMEVSAAWCASYLDDGGARGQLCSVSEKSCATVIGLSKYQRAGREYDHCVAVHSGPP